VYRPRLQSGSELADLLFGRASPRQQRGKLADPVIIDARQHLGVPGLPVDAVELRRRNQHEHRRGPLAAAVSKGHLMRAARDIGRRSTPDDAGGRCESLEIVARRRGLRLDRRRHARERHGHALAPSGLRNRDRCLGTASVRIFPQICSGGSGV